jgi:hypothetical protein
MMERREDNSKPSDLSLRGSVSSLKSVTGGGMTVIRSGIGAIVQGNRAAMRPGRVESFDQAMARLGLSEIGLPLINNQIVLQFYLTFFIGVIAMTLGVNYLIKGHAMAGAAGTGIALACLAAAAQASMRSYSIRHRSLGITSIWLASPSQWIPSMMEGYEPWPASDPARHPALVANLAARAKVLMWVGLGFLVSAPCAAIAKSALGWNIGQLSLVLAFVGMIVAYFGCKNSLEVFRRRHGLHCDALFWLAHPKEIIPSVVWTPPHGSGSDAETVRKAPSTRRQTSIKAGHSAHSAHSAHLPQEASEGSSIRPKRGTDSKNPHRKENP